MPDDPESLAKLIQQAGSVAMETPGNPDAAGPWALAIPGSAPFVVAEELVFSPPVVAAVGQSLAVAYDGQRLLRGLGHAGCVPGRIFCILTASRLLQDGLPVAHDLDSLTARYLRQQLHGILPRNDWGELFRDPSGLMLDRCAPLHDLARAMRRALTSSALSAVFQLEMRVLKGGMNVAATEWVLDLESLSGEASRAMADSRRAGEALTQMLGSPGLHPENPAHLQRALAHAGLPVASLATVDLLKVNEGRIVPALISYRAGESRARALKALFDAAAPHGQIPADEPPLAGGSLAAAPENAVLVDPAEFFAAGPGFVNLGAEYPHLGVFLIASLSGEPLLLEALRCGGDPDLAAAAAVFGKPAAELNPQEILAARSANETLLFGQGAGLLAVHAADRHGIVLPDPVSLRRRYFSALPAVARWHEDCQRLARSRPEEVRSVLGRRWLLPEGANSWQRFTALVGTPVPGGSMDLLQSALVLAFPSLPESTKILQARGNRILLSCQQEDEDVVAGSIRDAMEGAAQKLFPDMPPAVRITRCGSTALPAAAAELA